MEDMWNVVSRAVLENRRFEISVYTDRGQIYLKKSFREQFEHRIEIDINPANPRKLVITELEEGIIRENYFSKKLCAQISEAVGITGNMKFIFIQNQFTECWEGVLLPDMKKSYLWEQNFKEMSDEEIEEFKTYKERIMILLHHKFYKFLELGDVKQCLELSCFLVHDIDETLREYYITMYAIALLEKMVAVQRRCKKIESSWSVDCPLARGTSFTLLDTYQYWDVQFDYIEIKEFKESLTMIEKVVLKYLMQEKSLENVMSYGYGIRNMLINTKLSLQRKAIDYYGRGYIRSILVC